MIVKQLKQQIMKTKKNKIQLLGCFLVLVLTTSCSIEKLADSFECDSAPLFEEARVEKIFYQEALDAYAQEQSADNCKELKASGSDYINAVQKYIDCSKEGDEQVKRELKDAEKVLADLEC